jgi:hypothetical protein
VVSTETSILISQSMVRQNLLFGRRYSPAGTGIALCAALVVSIIWGCASDARDGTGASGPRTETLTSGDTTVVRTLSGSVWGDTARLVPEITIGVLDGEEEYMFGGIRSLAVSPVDGTVYVFDSQVPALRVYDADGTYRTTFGRDGGGPGEYAQPDGGLTVLSDGRVLLRDPGNGRIMVYSPEGEEVETWPVRGGFSSSTGFLKDRDDNVHVQVLLDPEASLSEWRMGLAKVHPDGTSTDTLAIPESPWEPEFLEASNENSATRTNIPYGARELWALSPLGYFVIAISDTYAMNLLRPDSTVLRIERVAEAPPVQAGERDEARRGVIRNMRRVDPNWRWNTSDIPDRRPFIESIQVSEEGDLWVHRPTEGYEVEDPGYDPDDPEDIPDTWRSPWVFDVFRADGTYLGAVSSDHTISGWVTPVIRDGRMWAVTTDELGVQRVVRFRVEAPGVD